MKQSSLTFVRSWVVLSAISVLVSLPVVHAGSRGDYNVGGGAGTSIEIGGGTTGLGGVFANGEFVSLGRDSAEFAIKDMVFFDARLTSFIGGGVSVNEGDLQGAFNRRSVL